MDSIEYKCPNCDADLKFNPDTQKLDCEYCSSSFTVDEIKNICAQAENSISTQEAAQEQPNQQAQEEFAEHTNLYQCASCGAEIMADDQQTALFCYYCHNPVILSGKMAGRYRPSKVIGFKLTRDRAVQVFSNWIGGRMFVPSDFKSSQQLEKLTGLYVPFWLADCYTSADYHALGKQTRSWTSGGYRYTETKEYDVIRRADIVAKGIPADGESKIEDALMEAIEPYDYSELKNFSMSYLSGFYADKYDVDKAQVFPRIRERCNNASKDYIRQSVNGYSSVSVHNENYNIQRTDWNYMLLPVWFMTYKYKDQVYEFAMNGQTGKIAGTPPLSKAKLFWFCAAIGAALTVLGTLLGGAML